MQGVMTSSPHSGLDVQIRHPRIRRGYKTGPRRPWCQPYSSCDVSGSEACATTGAGLGSADIPASTVIVGGGPCGLAAAMALSQMGWRDIEVWDKLAHPRPSDDGLWGTGDRSYNIGITDKGTQALRELGVYDRVLKCCAPIMYRQEWNPQSPEGKRTSEVDGRKDPTQVIQRDRLVACMLEHVEEEYVGKVRVRHSIQVQQLAVQPGGKVSLKWSQTADHTGHSGTEPEGVVQAEFLVGADGASSVVRKLLEEQGIGRVHSVKLEEKRQNTRVYKTIMIPVQDTKYSGPDGSGVCTLAERSSGGRVFESLPTKEGNQIGLMLFKIDDEEVLSISNEEEAADLLKREFPNLYPLIPRSEIKAFAERPHGKLPTFQYVWPDLHFSNNVVLAGDAIHTMKPYFGLGVNSALDDVMWLSQCLQLHTDDRAAALQLYSKERSLDAQAVVVESHKADQGFWKFIFPIIMDSIFNKLFPFAFRPSMFKLMNQGGLRFSEVRRRKRLDRTIQFSMIGVFLALVCTAVWKLFNVLKVVPSTCACAFRVMVFALDRVVPLTLEAVWHGMPPIKADSAPVSRCNRESRFLEGQQEESSYLVPGWVGPRLAA
eukprot:jgi/Ulvmu1/3211/UM015_0252.1